MERIDERGHPGRVAPYPDQADVHSTGSESAPDTDSQTRLKTWKGYIWDTFELPSDQRRLLFKVDAFILTFSSIGYFLKNLDLNNVNNAFLSGMKEDLGMYGNELVTSASLLS